MSSFNRVDQSNYRDYGSGSSDRRHSSDRDDRESRVDRTYWSSRRERAYHPYDPRNRPVRPLRGEREAYREQPTRSSEGSSSSRSTTGSASSAQSGPVEARRLEEYFDSRGNLLPLRNYDEALAFATLIEAKLAGNEMDLADFKRHIQSLISRCDEILRPLSLRQDYNGKSSCPYTLLFIRLIKQCSFTAAGDPVIRCFGEHMWEFLNERQIGATLHRSVTMPLVYKGVQEIIVNNANRNAGNKDLDFLASLFAMMLNHNVPESELTPLARCMLRRLQIDSREDSEKQKRVALRRLSFHVDKSENEELRALVCRYASDVFESCLRRGWIGGDEVSFVADHISRDPAIDQRKVEAACRMLGNASKVNCLGSLDTISRLLNFPHIPHHVKMSLLWPALERAEHQHNVCADSQRTTLIGIQHRVWKFLVESGEDHQRIVRRLEGHMRKGLSLIERCYPDEPFQCHTKVLKMFSHLKANLLVDVINRYREEVLTRYRGMTPMELKVVLEIDDIHQIFDAESRAELHLRADQLAPPVIEEVENDSFTASSPLDPSEADVLMDSQNPTHSTFQLDPSLGVLPIDLPDADNSSDQINEVPGSDPMIVIDENLAEPAEDQPFVADDNAVVPMEMDPVHQQAVIRFRKAWKIFKSIVEESDRFSDRLQASGGSWDPTLITWEEIQDEFEDKTDDYPITDLGNLKCMIKHFIAVLRDESMPRRAGGLELPVEAYKAILHAKLQEAKWRVYRSLLGGGEPVYNYRDMEVPTLVLCGDDDGVRVHQYMAEFNEDGLLMGISRELAREEFDLGASLGFVTEGVPLNPRQMQLLKKRVAALKVYDGDGRELPVLVLAVPGVSRDPIRPYLNPELHERPAISRFAENDEGVDEEFWLHKSKDAANAGASRAKHALLKARSSPSYALEGEYNEVEDDSRVLSVLKPYQQATVRFGNNLRRVGANGAIYADQMGLGKTMQAAATAFMAWNGGSKDVLFVTPKSIRKQSKDAFARYWQDFQMCILSDTARQYAEEAHTCKDPRPLGKQMKWEKLVIFRQRLEGLLSAHAQERNVLSEEWKETTRTYQEKCRKLRNQYARAHGPQRTELNRRYRNLKEEYNENQRIYDAELGKRFAATKTILEMFRNIDASLGAGGEPARLAKSAARIDAAADPIFRKIDTFLKAPENAEELKQMLAQRSGDAEAPAGVIFATPDQLKSAREALAGVQFDSIIVDEAHLAADPTSALAQTLAGIHRDFTVLLTGTPYRNGLKDVLGLMALMNLVNQETQALHLRDVEHSSIRLFNRISEADPDADKLDVKVLFNKLQRPFERMEMLRHAIRTIMSRHVREDIIDQWEGHIPSKSVRHIDYALTPTQKQLLEELEVSASSNYLDRHWTAQRIQIHPELAHTSFQEINETLNHLSPEQLMEWIGESALLSAFIQSNELKDAIEQGLPTIIYADQLAICRLLQSTVAAKFGLTLKDIPIFSGKINHESERNKLISNFTKETDGSPRIMIMSRGAGGVGLDLNARRVFILERGFEPFDDKQLEDRSVRANRTGNVDIWYMRSDAAYEAHLGFIREQKEIEANYLLPKAGDQEASLVDNFSEFLDMLYAQRTNKLAHKLNPRAWERVKAELLALAQRQLPRADHMQVA